MAYYNDDELYQYFSKSINEQAEKKLAELRKEIDYAYAKAMKRVKEDLILEKNIELNKGLGELRSTYQNKINQIGVGYDEQLIKKRLEMSKEVFKEVVEKIQSFVKSKKYEAYVKNKVKEVLADAPKSDYVFKVSPKDNKIKEIIQSINKDYKVEDDNSIIYGGFTLYIPKRNVEINETIDGRLEEQEDWFYKHSKLFIRD